MSLFAPFAVGMALAAAQTGVTDQALRFCLAAHNLPFSTSHPPWGINVQVAKELGQRLGREVEFVWQEAAEESPEQALSEERCDVAMGAIVDPGEMARSTGVSGLALTDSYYGAGYLLIHSKTTPSPRSLEQTGRDRIAVEMVSIPIYTLKQKGRKVYALDDAEAVVEAVADGRARYGYLWGPIGAWLLRERTDVALANAFEPIERWEFAIAVREEDGALLRDLNAELRQSVESKEIQRIFVAFGVPYLVPSWSRPEVQTGPDPVGAAD